MNLLFGPVWAILKAFLTTNGFMAALLIGGGVVLYSYDQSRVQAGRAIEANEREKSNAKAVDLAKRGADGAGSRRVPDPYARSQ